jgi:hypothetical protein
MMENTDVVPAWLPFTPNTRTAHQKPSRALPYDYPGQSAENGGHEARNTLNESSLSLRLAGAPGVGAALGAAGPVADTDGRSENFFPRITGACYHARHELCTVCGCNCHPSIARP